MEHENFKHLLKSRAPISQSETQELAVLLQQFPYFQCARALQLKGFKTNFDPQYNQALKITASYTTDRNVLFNYITSHYFLDFVPKKDKTQNISELEYPKKSTDILELEDEKTATIALETPLNNTTIIEKSQPLSEIGNPLTFESNDSFSFNEWLQLAALKPIVRSEIANNAATKKEIQSTLIDKFISDNPKIKSPDKNMPAIDFTVKSTAPNEQLMTETLARVYLEQKKYENAIKAYKILCLKYPEKSGYFADQIRAIKNIQNNQIS